LVLLGLSVTDFSIELPLFGGNDNTDCNGLVHVSNGESTKGRKFFEGFDAHGLGWLQGNDTTVTGLKKFWVFFDDLIRSSVDLALDVSEFTGDVGLAAINDWSVTIADLTRVLKNNNLGLK
jgi:hypothetical protein